MGKAEQYNTLHVAGYSRVAFRCNRQDLALCKYVRTPKVAQQR